MPFWPMSTDDPRVISVTNGQGNWQKNELKNGVVAPIVVTKLFKTSLCSRKCVLERLFKKNFVFFSAICKTQTLESKRLKRLM